MRSSGLGNPLRTEHRRPFSRSRSHPTARYIEAPIHVRRSTASHAIGRPAARSLWLSCRESGLHFPGRRKVADCSAVVARSRSEAGSSSTSASGVPEASADGAREESSSRGQSQEEDQEVEEEWRQVDWSGLPLDEMKRPGEAAWGPDPEGPLGAEKIDNVWGKTQEVLNSEAIQVIGMGTWRLQAFVSELSQVLVANIEGAWRHMIDNLGLHPLPKAWRYVDSLDPKGKYGSWSYQDLEPPAKGQPGYPRLQIENRCYRSRAFRKLHMEVAHRQDNLEVLHCVMYPWVDFDLPILSLDLVATDGVVSLGIIDPCPVSLDRSLPPAYVQVCRTLQKEYLVENNRAVPEWGKEIFSEHCIMLRPKSEGELANFIKYVIALTRVHLRLAHNADPIEHNRASRMHAISAAHTRYREKQLMNSKTRRVLEAAFGKEFAEEYMSGLMFDLPPKEPDREKDQSGSSGTKDPVIP